MHPSHQNSLCQSDPSEQAVAPQVLEGVRILSLALNLPGPAALMRCQQMGAQCIKLEPPTGDPMQHYSPAAYAELHKGIEVLRADLKSAAGQQLLDQRLATTDVLLTSFRPSAIHKLGLNWTTLHERYPALSHVAIVGSPGAAAEHAGHDLTYMAGEGLVTGLALPATLFADMGGSLLASQAVLQAVMRQRMDPSWGIHTEVALSSAAHYLAMPRRWGLTQPSGTVGGAHAGYAMYACLDGRVAVAALEPHFAQALGKAAGLGEASTQDGGVPEAHARLIAFFASKTRSQLDTLAQAQDIPLLTLPPAD